MKYNKIFENNRRWAEQKKSINPEFFKLLAEGQKPEYLFIGCSDSRIPPELLCGAEPGDLFVHRNIANIVSAEDQNIMSVISFAVNHLKVKHIIVCGHSHCGGVHASLKPDKGDSLDPWLNNIRQVQKDNVRELDSVADKGERYLRLTELNTLQQCRNISELDIVKSSQSSSSFPQLHAWMFDIESGELRDLNFCHPERSEESESE